MKVEHCCKDLLAMALRVRQATRELVDWWMGMGVGGFLRRNHMKIEGKSLEQRNTWSESDTKTRYIGKVPAFVLRFQPLKSQFYVWKPLPNFHQPGFVEAASALRQILSATVGGLRFFSPRGNGGRDGWHFTYIRGHEVRTKEDVVGLSNFEDCDKFVECIWVFPKIVVPPNHPF